MFWKKICFASVVTALLLAVTVSCAGKSTRVPLTEAEKDAVTAHIRNFIKRSRTLRLSKADMRVIENSKPRYSIHYVGNKEGFMSVHWRLPAYRSLILQRSGNLLGNVRSDWTIRLINDKTSGKIPSNFFGAKGEDISLPQGR